MKRCAYALALLALFGLIVVTEPASAQNDKKTRTVKEVMKLAHAGKSSLLNTIDGDLKDMKWEDLGKKVKELASLADDMAAATPKKGEADSWKKLTVSYKTGVTKLSEASTKKEAEPAKAAMGTLRGSCKECHTNHR